MNYHLNGYICRRTNQQLLEDLTNTAKKLNQTTLSNHQYRITGSYCPSIITRRFGSWNNALRLAGLTVTKHYNISVRRLILILRCYDGLCIFHIFAKWETK
jgi:hypothetical protein